jgi:hypothetical protein
MIRYRIRITLLALGVALGYGSAIAHLTGHGGHGRHAACAWQ